MKRSRFAALFCAVMAVVFLAQPMFAQKAFLEQLKAAYPGLDTKLAKCTTCHTPAGGEKPGKKNLNLYGKDLQGSAEAKAAMGSEHKGGKYSEDELKGVLAGIKAIGSKDSNGNGKSNDDDIKAGVNPGVK